jgi:hypothetical protein
MLQVRRLGPYAVDKRPIRRTEVAKKCLRRGDLQDAVVAREKPIVRKTKMRVFATAD